MSGVLGDSWKGGSARAAVREYVTRSGKKVRAHTRKVVRQQSQVAGRAVLGKTIMRAINGKGDNFWLRLADAVALQLTSGSTTKGKARRRRR